MQIYVCVKHVPDTAANIKIIGENRYNESDCKFVMNPYDEYAVEQAVQLVEKYGGEVILVTVGSGNSVSTIRNAMAMGAHRGILVTSEESLLDSDVTSRALNAAIEQDGKVDLVITGKGAIDTEGFQTMYRLADYMSLPVVNEIVKMEFEDNEVIVEREIGGGTRERIKVSMPCVLGATKGLNVPRYPKFPDIMKAKKKPIKQMSLADIGIDSSTAKLKLSTLKPAPERSQAKIIEGSVEDQVIELVRILSEDEKVL